MKNEFYIEMCKGKIEMNKRILRTNYGLLILNTIVFIGCVYSVYLNGGHGWFSGVGVGASGCTSFWIWLGILENRMDLKIEKEKLAWWEKYNETGYTGWFADSLSMDNGGLK